MSNATNLLRAAMVLGLILLCVGCDEDELSPYPYATLVGQVVNIGDGSPVDSVEVTLVDLDRVSTVAITNTDAEGHFAFSRIEPGDYHPLVRANERRTYYLPQARWTLAARDTVHVTIPVRTYIFNPDSIFIVHGRVIDGDTLEPIAFARVEMSDVHPMYNPFGVLDGRASTLEPVSDENGYFDLGPMPDYRTEDGTPITRSWRVSHPEYLDRSFRPFEDYNIPDSMSVRLTRGIDAHALVGRVVDRDQVPVEGVSVLVDWRRGTGELFKDTATKVVTGTGSAAITDSLGRYRIEALPAGWFNIRCGAYRDDGWLDTNLFGVEIVPGADSTQVMDLIVLPAIVPVSPRDYETVSERPILEWEPIPGASIYRLTLQRAISQAEVRLEGDSNTFSTAQSGFFQTPGLYLWRVNAFDASRQQLAGSERFHSWVYEPDAIPAPNP